MRIRTIALALPLMVGGAACSTTGSQRTQAAGPPPVAATEREGNAPANRPENQPGSGVGATAPGQAAGTAVNGSAMGGDTSAPGMQSTTGADGSSGAAASNDLKAHSDDEVISGTIRMVSAQSLTIASQDGTDRTLRLVPQTSLMVNGQEAQTTDLQEGLPVRASFSNVGDQDVAVDVRAGSEANGQSGATGADPSGSTGFQGTPGAGGLPGPGGGGPQGSDQPTPSRLPKRN